MLKPTQSPITKAMMKRDKRFRRLMNSKQFAAQPIAQQLRTCDPLQPKHRQHACLCPVCHICMEKRWQPAFEQAVLQEIGNDSALFVSIIPANSVAQPGLLNGFDHLNHRRRLVRALHGASFDWGVFVTDVSFNHHATGRYAPFWSLHWHGIVVGAKKQALFQHLKAKFSKTDAIPKPIKVDVWNGNSSAIRYLLTVDFDKRSGLDGQERFNKATGEIRLCRATRHRPLRAADEVELLIHLNGLGVRQRIVSISGRHGVRKFGHAIS